MLKKTLLLISIPVSFLYLKGQNTPDVSVITNTTDIYSGNPINGTAKYNAMAGSIGALGGDISSVNVNPAGIGVFITNDVNLTLGINNNKNTSTFVGKSLTNKNNGTDINNAGGVVSFNVGDNSKWKFVNVGVNYSNRSLDNTVRSDANGNIKIVDDFSYPDTVINYTYLGHIYDRTGNQSKMNFSVGANYDNRLYLGAGVNLHNSFFSQSDRAGFYSDDDKTSLFYDKQYTPYDEHSDGFSANIGVIAKLSNQFRVGAAIESPTWWNIERVYNQYYFNYNQVDLFREDRTLVTPMKATLSAAFVPSKNFALNVDFIQGITKPKYKEYGDAERELNDFFSDSYKNSSEVRVGAEYRIAAFRLRGGYAYQGNSFDNLSLLGYNNDGSTSEQSFSNLIVGKRNTIGAGLGYDFKAFYIDASYQNITSEYSNPFLQGNVNSDTGYFNGGYDVNSEAYAVSKVKNTRSNFFVTVGWKF